MPLLCVNFPLHTGIIGIRQSKQLLVVKSVIVEGLQQEPKELPSLVMWDDNGLHIYEKLCHYSPYYLRRCEIEILQIFWEYSQESTQHGDND